MMMESNVVAHKSTSPSLWTNMKICLDVIQTQIHVSTRKW
jgi:hypothetical protein